MSELSDADAMDIIYDKKEALKFNKNKPRESVNFKGEVHFIQEEPKDPPLSIRNKMELIQFSYNNRFFLFFDLILERFFVYELCI